MKVPVTLWTLPPLALLAANLVLAEWNTNEFMKREHSLVKPYQGWYSLLRLKHT